MWLLPSTVLWTPQQKPEALPTSLGCFKQKSPLPCILKPLLVAQKTPPSRREQRGAY